MSAPIREWLGILLFSGTTYSAMVGDVEGVEGAWVSRETESGEGITTSNITARGALGSGGSQNPFTLSHKDSNATSPQAIGLLSGSSVDGEIGGGQREEERTDRDQVEDEGDRQNRDKSVRHHLRHVGE